MVEFIKAIFISCVGNIEIYFDVNISDLQYAENIPHRWFLFTSVIEVKEYYTYSKSQAPKSEYYLAVFRLFSPFIGIPTLNDENIYFPSFHRATPS